jgi:chorismate mutase
VFGDPPNEREVRVAEPVRRSDVVDIADYLEETIRDIDEALAELAGRRAQLAFKLAVLRAASDPDVDDAAADLERRIAEGQPYENARPAEDVITEAHRRYIG